MTDEQKEKMREQAKRLAKDSKSSDPHVVKVFWFPHEKEVHIIEINDNTTPSDTSVAPFYFGPVPEEGLTTPSGIAIIKPEEYRKLDLPSDWGSWDDGEELENCMTWRDAYLQQAWSDFNVYQALNANSYALCHQLHYLQMATEKLAKGFQCSIGGGPYPKTHIAFVKFLQQIKQQPLIYYSRLQFKSKDQFSSRIQSLLPIADLIEKLAPAGGNYDKMNPEYPWTDVANNVYCPVSYGFPEFRRRERELLMIQNLLTNLFHLEGYQ